jgi:hypothetical protein
MMLLYPQLFCNVLNLVLGHCKDFEFSVVYDL